MLDAYLLEWGSLLLRWLHVIAGIAWIGSSFFFMHLDASLKPVPGAEKGVAGSSWQVHGGGFYEMKKFTVAPDFMPAELTWHKWQAYWTWFSGFFLLVWIYYAQSSLYLIDPAVMVLPAWQASAIGVASLVLGWAVYDALCRSPVAKNENVLALLGFGFVVAMAWFYAQVFSGRGAMIHIGALMATMMAGNVLMVIIPNQRRVVADLIAGRIPNSRYGKIGKQRSTHNNYITLPVVFMMLANHYPVTYANNAVIPVITALVIVAGAIIRHFYNIRHMDHARSPWWAWAVAGFAIWLAFWVAMASSPGGRDRLGLKQLDEQRMQIAGLALPPAHVTDIITGRCAMCHAPEPGWAGIQIAPKGVLLHTAERIALQKNAIRTQVVMTHAMPPNNLSEMTPAERQAVAAWARR
jgi:uncharacterized membrane protein